MLLFFVEICEPLSDAQFLQIIDGNFGAFNCVIPPKFMGINSFSFFLSAWLVESPHTSRPRTVSVDIPTGVRIGDYIFGADQDARRSRVNSLLKKSRFNISLWLELDNAVRDQLVTFLSTNGYYSIPRLAQLYKEHSSFQESDSKDLMELIPRGFRASMICVLMECYQLASANFRPTTEHLALYRAGLARKIDAYTPNLPNDEQQALADTLKRVYLKPKASESSIPELAVRIVLVGVGSDADAVHKLVCLCSHEIQLEDRNSKNVSISHLINHLKCCPCHPPPLPRGQKTLLAFTAAAHDAPSPSSKRRYVYFAKIRDITNCGFIYYEYYIYIYIYNHLSLLCYYINK